MTDKGDILVVDDTTENLKLLTELLTTEGYQVRPVNSGELALASVVARPPELILLDIHMPGMDGFAVCRWLKAREKIRDVPVMFISAAAEAKERVQGLKFGAVDFVSKPFQREELLARVQTHLELSRLRARLEQRSVDLLQANERLQLEIAERKRVEEQMRELSVRDQLTELFNRRGFITHAAQRLKAAKREKKRIVLLFIDLDGMKRINDDYGHEDGDKALIDTADILRRTFRESDIIARLGGDEFAVIADDASELNSSGFLTRLRQNIDAGNAKGSRQYRLAMSWGAAEYDPEAPVSLDQLMSAADEAMYAQKKAKTNKRM